MAEICVIEDNPQNSRMVTKLLRASGHLVRVADTGEEGLMAVLDQAPDLLLIDLGLPDIDGQTVIAMLRQQPEMFSVPLIAFTAWPAATAVSMAKAYGCDGVITKPIDTRSFVTQIETYIKNHVPPKADQQETQRLHNTPELPQKTGPSRMPLAPDTANPFHDLPSSSSPEESHLSRALKKKAQNQVPHRSVQSIRTHHRPCKRHPGDGWLKRGSR